MTRINNCSQTILLLTGASSSGKSTMTKQLRNILGDNYLSVGLDDITAAIVPSQYLSYDPNEEQPDANGLQFITEYDEIGPIVKIEASSYIKRIFKTFGPLIKALADKKFNVIADGGFTYNIEFFYSILATLKNYNVYLINVTAPLPIMIEREKQRGGFLGNARGQLETILKNDKQYSLEYDLTIDTAAHSIDENIDIILNYIAHHKPFAAYKNYLVLRPLALEI